MLGFPINHSSNKLSIFSENNNKKKTLPTEIILQSATYSITSLRTTLKEEGLILSGTVV